MHVECFSKGPTPGGASAVVLFHLPSCLYGLWHEVKNCVGVATSSGVMLASGLTEIRHLF